MKGVTQSHVPMWGRAFCRGNSRGSSPEASFLKEGAERERRGDEVGEAVEGFYLVRNETTRRSEQSNDAILPGSGDDLRLQVGGRRWDGDSRLSGCRWCYDSGKDAGGSEQAVQGRRWPPSKGT